MPRVLIVDDERSTLWLMQHYLSEAGFETAATSDGSEAAAMLRDAEAQFDLLLTDVWMPGVSGYELARLAAERRPEVPVLFVSGFSFDPLAPARGITGFLPKPFNGEKLIRAVSDLLGKPAVWRARAGTL